MTDAYVEHVRDLLASISDLRFRKMFGGMGIYTGSRMFALIAGDQLYIKADALTRGEFEAAGSAPITMLTKDGRTMSMSYWRLPPSAEDDPTEARRWAELGVDTAARAAAPRPSRGRSAAGYLGPGPWDE